MPDPNVFDTTPAYESAYRAPRIIVKTSGTGSGGSPSAYAWTQQCDDGAGNYINDTNGLSGTQANSPLFMADGSATVPAGTICEAEYYYGGWYKGWPIKSSSSSPIAGVATVYKPQCDNGNLNRYVSAITIVNGVLTQTAWVLESSLCASCGCGSPPPSCPTTPFCANFAGITGAGCSAMTSPGVTLVNGVPIFSSVPCTWAGAYTAGSPPASAGNIVLSVDTVNNKTTLAVGTGGVLGPLFYSASGVWNFTSPITLTANGQYTYWTCVMPLTVTIMPGICPGSGGSTTPVRTNLSTASALNSRTASTSTFVVDSGQELIVTIAYRTIGGVPTPVVTFGTVTLSNAGSAINTGVFVGTYKTSAAVGGGVVTVDLGVGATADILVSACEVSVIAGTTDLTQTASGSSSNPTVGPFTTAHAIEYASAATVATLPSSPISNLGTPQNGFSAGQVVSVTGTGGTRLELRDDYQILQSVVALTPAVDYGPTATKPVLWAMYLSSYS